MTKVTEIFKPQGLKSPIFQVKFAIFTTKNCFLSIQLALHEKTKKKKMTLER